LWWVVGVQELECDVGDCFCCVGWCVDGVRAGYGGLVFEVDFDCDCVFVYVVFLVVGGEFGGQVAQYLFEFFELVDVVVECCFC